MSTTKLLLGLCVVFLSGFFYQKSHSVDSISHSTSSTGVPRESSPEVAVQQMQLTKEIGKYLKAKPAEFDEQLSQVKVLLGQHQYEKADALLESTRKLFPDQPDLLVFHAETIASMNKGSFAGKPFDLLSRSLDIDNRHKPSLWTMALVNQQMGNHEAAVILFKLLKREIPSDSHSIETIDAAMAVSVERIDTRH